MTFKSYVAGSYFGDIEVIRNSPRLFSIKAQQTTKVLTIKVSDFSTLMDKFPHQYHRLLGQAISRYLDVKKAMIKIESFEKISTEHNFWNAPQSGYNLMNVELSKWLDRLAEVKDELPDDKLSMLSFKISKSRAGSVSSRRSIRIPDKLKRQLQNIDSLQPSSSFSKSDIRRVYSM